MKAAPIFWISVLVTLSMASITASATPVDAGAARDEKAERSVQAYKNLPSEAFGACLGRAVSTPCTYVLQPTNSRPFSQRVEGSCGVPEALHKMPLACR